MKFSERHGYIEPSRAIQRETISDHLKTRLWNVFYNEIFSAVEYPLENKLIYGLLERCWDSVFKLDILDFRNIGSLELTKRIRLEYFILKWYAVYDLIEFILESITYEGLARKINLVLKEEGSAYRIVNNQVVEITSEEEIKEIEEVFKKNDRFDPVKQHISKALKFLSDREKPDYENSVKESVSALESLSRIVTGENKTLGYLINKLDIHKALKDSISKLYGWASDEGGVRHSSSGNPSKLDEEEARLVLITSSALINYIIAKQGDEREN